MTVPVNRCDPYTTCGGVEYTGIPAAQDPRIPLYFAKDFVHVDIALL